MNKKTYARFITGLFCGALALTVAANALTPDKDFSEVENRKLAQRPEVTAASFKLAWPIRDSGSIFTGEFMSDYETYTTDQFVARDVWVAGKAWSERLTGKQENNGVYFCDDGTLITRVDAPKQEQLEKNIGYVGKFVDKAGVPVSVGLIPNAACVWADKLPAGAPNYDQREIWAQVSNGLAGKVTPVDSLWSVLPAHKDEPIFYRTDHHWTSLGAYYGYAALGEALGYTPLSLDTYTKTTVSTEFYGTVFSSSGVRWVKPDEMDIYVPETDAITVTSYEMGAGGQLTGTPRELYDESCLTKKDKYAMFLGGQQALCKVTTGNAGPKLLIIRDSYSDSLVPFLTPHFSEIHLIDSRYYKFSPSEYIAQNGIDQALVLYSASNFASETNLLWITR